MALNRILNTLSAIVPTNADSVYWIADGKKVSVDEVRGIQNGEAVSIWKKQKHYFIAFVSNGGSGSMNKQTMPVGEATALAANLFTRLGYLFSGWAKSQSGAKEYDNTQVVTDIAAAGETATLYALWSAITYYVRFHPNGGSGSMSNQRFTYDVAGNLSANGFSRVGYTFASWEGVVADATMVFANKQEVINLASDNGAIVDLSAIWNPITYYVKYNGNGNNGGSTAQSTHTYDEARALTANGFTKLNRSFQGWATSSGGDVVYSDKESVKNLKSVHGATLNLYAVWKQIYGDAAVTAQDLSPATVYFSNAIIHTAYAGIDTSIYYGVRVNMPIIGIQQDFAGCSVKMYLTDGTTKVYIGRAETDAPDLDIVKDVTINFSQTSGTVNLSVGIEGDGHGYRTITFGTVTLLAR